MEDGRDFSLVLFDTTEKKESEKSIISFGMTIKGKRMRKIMI